MSSADKSMEGRKTAPVWPVPQSGQLKRIGAAAGLGADFEALRSAASEKLGCCGLPQAGEELWRFTRPQQFAFGDSLATSGCRFGLNECGEGAAQADFPGLGVYEGQKAFEKEPELLRHLLGDGQEDVSSQGAVHLQTALTSSLHLVVVEKNVRLTTPLLLSQMPLVPKSQQCAPWIVVLLQPGAQLSLVEDLAFDYQGVYFPRIEIVARDNSVLDFVSLQRLNVGASYLGRHRFHLERDVTGRIMHAFLGGRAARLDLDCRLLGQGASVEMRSLYVADGQRLIDFHPTQDHVAPNCQSKLLCKGVVKERARAVYYGYIRVAEAAQKTDAYQTNRNLLFSSEARADSIPNLEIKANDVRCSHGSSVGQVGADELFYLMSRGLSRDLAEKLLVEGFFEEVLAGFSNLAMHEVLSSAVMERLQYGSSRSGN